MAKHKLFCGSENISPLSSSRAIKSKSTKENDQVSDKTMKSNSDFLPVRTCDSDSDSDSDSDTWEVISSTSGAKLPYTFKEDEWILKFVLKGQNIFRVMSISLWKFLESKKDNPKRSYQSLKNRFLRNIKPQLFTTYRHLITDKVLTERILTKFPELKHKVGVKKIPSRIQLPAREAVSQSARNELTSASRDDERVMPPSSPPADGQPEDLYLHELPNFRRKVKITNKSLEISVNLLSKGAGNPKTPSLGIYGTYEKLKKNNKLVLCTTCGRYNRPKRSNSEGSSTGGKSLKLSGESDVLIVNSLDPSPSANCKRPPTKSCGVGEENKPNLEPAPCGSTSPSLLNDTGGGDPDHPSGITENSEIGQIPETSNSVALRQDSAAKDQLRGMDEDLNSYYADTVTNFKKLITNEESLLIKRCLQGNPLALEISDSLFEISLESYFVDLSQDLKTPFSSSNYRARSHGENKSEIPRSLLAGNMMKMLEGNKTQAES